MGRKKKLFHKMKTKFEFIFYSTRHRHFYLKFMFKSNAPLDTFKEREK